MPRGKANGSKVTFLRSPYEEGERLELPLKLKYYNIIEHSSLPQCRRKETRRRRPIPHSDVYDIPASYWPPEDTPLVPETMGAEDVWNECKKNIRNRKTDKRRDTNLSNSARKHNYIECSSMSENFEVEHLLHKLERFPRHEWRQDFLSDMRQDFRGKEFYNDHRRSELDRQRNYVNVLKNAYLERGLQLGPGRDDTFSIIE